MVVDEVGLVGFCQADNKSRDLCQAVAINKFESWHSQCANTSLENKRIGVAVTRFSKEATCTPHFYSPSFHSCCV